MVIAVSPEASDMAEVEKDIDQFLDAAERLGVIGSPSSTAELALDVLGSAVNRKLVGELALFRFVQDTTPHYALGQITEVQLRNIWHEDPTMRSLIRQRGRVDAVSERQDTHLAKMIISAVFARNSPRTFQPSMLGTVPATGTAIHQVDDPILDELLRPYREQIFYLGHVYGSKPRLPLWFKHFGQGPAGAGEAYHFGVFGKTGSGKSVLAKMLLTAYARYPGMAILVVDPQGEFAKDMTTGGAPGQFRLPLKELIQGLGKQCVTLTVRNLVLDRWEMFEEILAESRFFRELQIMTSDKRLLACDVLVQAMREHSKVALARLTERDQFDLVWKLLSSEGLRNKIYAREGAAAQRFTDALAEADKDRLYEAVWKPLAGLFFEGHRRERKSINKAIGWLLSANPHNRPILIVDLSREKAGGLLWNERIQSLVIKRLLEGICLVAEGKYQEGESLNALVIIDEAHRLAPRELPRDDLAGRRVRSLLIDAARTTRKYGLGWMFISQTLWSLHPEILQQLRIFFFGFGLGLGQEFQALRQLVGSTGTALDLYQLFRDPHSAIDTGSRQYSWMTIGPVSPLSFSGTPLFFNAFNTVRAFLEANGLVGLMGTEAAGA